jgi:uncharacterized alkaline shock family protein YloU
MFCSLVLALYSFGFARTDFLPNILKGIYQRWDIGVLLMIGFVLGGVVIYPIFNLNTNRTTRISQSKLGEVNITLGALDNIIKKVTSRQNGVAEIETSLKNSEEGLEISLTGMVNPGVVIPELTDELQKLVKSYVEDTTGVTVSKVRVLVKELTEKRQLDDSQ